MKGENFLHFFPEVGDLEVPSVKPLVERPEVFLEDEEPRNSRRSPALDEFEGEELAGGLDAKLMLEQNANRFLEKGGQSEPFLQRELPFLKN